MVVIVVALGDEEKTNKNITLIRLVRLKLNILHYIYMKTLCTVVLEYLTKASLSKHLFNVSINMQCNPNSYTIVS